MKHKISVTFTHEEIRDVLIARASQSYIPLGCRSGALGVSAYNVTTFIHINKDYEVIFVFPKNKNEHK